MNIRRILFNGDRQKIIKQPDSISLYDRLLEILSKWDVSAIVIVLL